MKLVVDSVSLDELVQISRSSLGGLVKAVVDIKKRIMVIDASMHADEEKFLLDEGSKQDELWGINLYPEQKGEDFIEFDSMINIRPRLNNFSRSVENEEIRKKIIDVVKSLIKD